MQTSAPARAEPDRSAAERCEALIRIANSIRSRTEPECRVTLSAVTFCCEVLRSVPMRSMLTGVLLMAGTMAVRAPAQTFGDITGVVTDPSGAVVIGANVTVSNPQTSAKRSAITNNAGNYNFPALLPGV